MTEKGKPKENSTYRLIIIRGEFSMRLYTLNNHSIKKTKLHEGKFARTTCLVEARRNQGHIKATLQSCLPFCISKFKEDQSKQERTEEGSLDN